MFIISAGNSLLGPPARPHAVGSQAPCGSPEWLVSEGTSPERALPNTLRGTGWVVGKELGEVVVR